MASEGVWQGGPPDLIVFPSGNSIFQETVNNLLTVSARLWLNDTIKVMPVELPSEVEEQGQLEQTVSTETREGSQPHVLPQPPTPSALEGQARNYAHTI